jgi:hypothetical protein
MPGTDTIKSGGFPLMWCGSSMGRDEPEVLGGQMLKLGMQAVPLRDVLGSTQSTLQPGDPSLDPSGVDAYL